MSEMKDNANKLITGNIADYTMLEIVHHEMGNGLAVISGYTKLLLRSMLSQEEEICEHNLEKASQHNKKRLAYLRIMDHREAYLNDFLAQLRTCSTDVIEKSFSQCQVKTNLVSLVRHTIERLAPLHKEHTLQTHLPTHPLYVRCNPLWMDFAVEHILSHNIAAHKASTPVIIEVKQDIDRSNDLDEVRIVMHINRGSAEQNTQTKELFDVWSQTLDARDQDLCIALCTGIFREHGGRIWVEPDGEQREVLFAALPHEKSVQF